jgi:hypothetical protein
LGLAAAAWSQTAIDVRTQTKDVDFSGAVSTKPFKTGTSLPSTCTTGAAFLNLAATAGQNLYLCTATNTWVQVQNGNQTITWTAAGTTSLAPALTVTGLRGVSLPALSTGNLRYSGGAWVLDSATYLSSMWGSGSRPVAANALGTSGDCVAWGSVGLVDAGAPCGSGSGSGSGGGASMFQQLGDFALTYSGTSGVIGASCSPAAPCIAAVGYGAYTFTSAATVTASGSGADTYYVYVNSGGTLMVGYGGSAAPVCSGCTVMAGVTSYPAGAATVGRFTVSGGEIVAAVSDRAVITAPPTLVAGSNVSIATAGNVVTISSTGGGSGSLASTVVETNQSNAYTTGTQDFHAAAHTLPMVTGATAGKPGTCAQGETYFATDATAGQNIYLCSSTNNWTQMSAGSFDPLDRTILFKEQMMQGGWTADSFWGAQGGNCGGDTPYSTGLTAGEPMASEWSSGSGTVCAFFGPFLNSASGAFPLTDFVSGSSPLNWGLYYDFAVVDERQNEYVGLSQTAGSNPTMNNFVGIRWDNANTRFECVIRSGGADVVSTSMGVAYSANVMRYQISNAGTANSVTCQIGSTAATTVTGTMPAGGWYTIAGADWTSGTGSQPHFAIAQARLKISGRSATN